MKRRTRRLLDKKSKIVKEDFFKLLKKAVSVPPFSLKQPAKAKR